MKSLPDNAYPGMVKGLEFAPGQLRALALASGEMHRLPAEKAYRLLYMREAAKDEGIKWWAPGEVSQVGMLPGKQNPDKPPFFDVSANFYVWLIEIETPVGKLPARKSPRRTRKTK